MSVKNIEEQIANLKKEFAALPALTPEITEKLNKKLRLEFHYHSNHIEGNTLTYSETELALIFDESRGNHTIREYEEMKASDVALEIVRDFANEKDSRLAETFIKNLNTILLVRPYYKEAKTFDGQPSRRKIQIGEYKKFPNSVDLPNGENVFFTSPADTPIEMGNLMNWYHSVVEQKIMSPLQLAAFLHHRFVSIHPFDDGNGRIARLLMNYVLLSHNLPIVIIKAEDKKNYLSALRDADTGNTDSFVIYIGKQLAWTLQLYISAASGENIDDRNDWKKKLALLQRELSGNEEIRIVKSPIVLHQLHSKELLPLLNQLDSELSDISSMFLEKKFYVYSPKKSFQRITLSEPIGANLFGEEFENELTFQFDFKEFLKNGVNSFNIEINVKFTFSRYQYSINFSEEEIVSRYYHQGLESHHVDAIISKIADFIISIIQSKRNKDN